MRTPAGPERHYISGVENFDTLGQRARERILDYYEGRGPLYHEERILERANRLGIGPQGLGGRTTALSAAILTQGTHIAGLPCAVNLGCHVTRHAHVVL